MFHLGGTEWIVILIVVLLLFGPGRIGRIAGELGRSIKSFREGISGSDEQAESSEKTEEKKQP